MGLAYFRVTPADFEPLQSLIIEHEADLLGPRARGFWSERPDSYDYQSVAYIAHLLHTAADGIAVARLELSENEAHSLSMLEIQLPGDDAAFQPSLFLCSANPLNVRKQLKIARRNFGPNPAMGAARLEAGSTDPRYMGYLQRTVTHLRATLPKVWGFYEDAEKAGEAVIVVDLRARDVEIPDAIEMMA